MNKLDALAKSVRKTCKTDIAYVGKMTGGSAAAGAVMGMAKVLVDHRQMSLQEASDVLLAASGTVGAIGLLYSLICWQIWEIPKK